MKRSEMGQDISGDAEFPTNVYFGEVISPQGQRLLPVYCRYSGGVITESHIPIALLEMELVKQGVLKEGSLK